MRQIMSLLLYFKLEKVENDPIIFWSFPNMKGRKVERRNFATCT